jgi:predicted RNase H-like HicB family nuclease
MEVAMRYPVVIHKDAGSSFGITVPDLPGVFTAGDSIEQAIANLQEAVEAAYDNEEEIPRPSAIERHLDNPDYEGGVFALADVDLTRLQGPVVRVNITLPQRDLDLIDRAARETGSNRSSFLRDAALVMARTLAPARRIHESSPPPYAPVRKAERARKPAARPAPAAAAAKKRSGGKTTAGAAKPKPARSRKR